MFRFDSVTIRLKRSNFNSDYRGNFNDSIDQF